MLNTDAIQDTAAREHVIVSMRARDAVSDERPSSEEKLLLRELNHRINNEFAAAIGFVSLTAARSRNDEVKTALASVMDCLHNYAQVHRALEMPSHDMRIDASAYLRRLCESIGRFKLEGRGIELVFVEHPFQMHSEQCWRLGMIVSELITNAARHAFGDNGGKIHIELVPSGPFVKCRVADNGRAAATVRPGRGLKIIEALVAGLDGTIEQHFGARGALSILTFPVNAAHLEVVGSSVS
jgi:two-component sensor histidine kinase